MSNNLDYIKKKAITDLLIRKKNDTGLSDKRLATQIGDVNETTVNHILNMRWHKNPQLVGETMFQRVASWLNMNEDWIINKEDHNFKLVQRMAEDARIGSDSFIIAAQPGLCKSEAAMDFQNRPNVFYIKCQEHYSKRSFLLKVTQAMGIKDARENISDMVDTIVNKLNRISKPLIILDEADKLSDKLIQFFITFYNETNMNCGFLFMGSVFFENRIRKGVNSNRQGFAEFFSRSGREIIRLQDLTATRIRAVCVLNGLDNELQITEVINRAENDYRVVKRRVQSFKKLNRANGSQLILDAALKQVGKEGVEA